MIIVAAGAPKHPPFTGTKSLSTSSKVLLYSQSAKVYNAGGHEPGTYVPGYTVRFATEVVEASESLLLHIEVSRARESLGITLVLGGGDDWSGRVDG